MTPTLVLIAVLCSLLIGFLGRHRRLGFWGFFFASLLLTPIFGLLLLVVSGPCRADARR